MRTISYFFSISSILFLVNGCGSSDKQYPATLELSTLLIELDKNGNEQSVDVMTNRDDWTYSLKQASQWCKIRQDDSRLYVSADPNEDIVPREDVIIVKSGNKTAEINVRQLADEARLELDMSEVTLDKVGSQVTVGIKTNIEYVSARALASWCSVKVSDGKGDKILTISAEENKSSQRETTVFVSGGVNTITLKVIQLSGKYCIKVDLPVDFTSSNVLGLYDDDNELVAMLCREYIRSYGFEGVLDVIYEVRDGEIVLSSGINLSNGGTVIWIEGNNSCVYTAGNRNLESIWVSEENGILREAPDMAFSSGTPQPICLNDVRGADVQTYNLVKIATKLWMAENLRAEKYADGTDIGQDWTLHEGAYIYLNDDRQSNRSTYGALYNGYAVLSPSSLCPNDWKMPDNDTWSMLIDYLEHDQGAALKALNGWTFSESNGLSGFNALAGQSYSTATGFILDMIETWFWSASIVNDPLFDETSGYYVRITDTSNDIVFSASQTQGSFHSQKFGHSVRCVKDL